MHSLRFLRAALRHLEVFGIGFLSFLVAVALSYGTKRWRDRKDDGDVQEGSVFKAKDDLDAMPTEKTSLLSKVRKVAPPISPQVRKV